MTEKGSAPPHARNGDNTRRTQNSWSNRYSTRNEEQREPAWMDDNQPRTSASGDLTVAEIRKSDPLVQFVPGEDKIAAHKRTLRARDAGEERRGQQPLVSFFSADPQGASLPTSADLPPGLPLPMPKQKLFNAADYLKPSKELTEFEHGLVDADAAVNVNKSRFQRFFSGASSIPVTPPAPPTPSRWDAAAEPPRDVASPPVLPIKLPPQSLSSVRSYSENVGPDHGAAPKYDDHMAKLMGMLGTKVCFCMYTDPDKLILLSRARISPLVLILLKVTERPNPDNHRIKHHQ